MLDATTLIGLDFETYGGTDLPTYGLHNYVNCSTFQPLIGSVVEYDKDWANFPRRRYKFFGPDRRLSIVKLEERIGSRWIVAHNAPFEQNVLRTLGLDYPSSRFIDSAVIARAMGAAGKLEAAAPQLLNTDKMEAGRNLIRLFSIPGKLQEENGSLEFDPRIIGLHPKDWDLFGHYCDLDAELGLRIVLQYLDRLPEKELEYARITMDMNDTGWPVDVPTVEEMQRRYLENQVKALEDFRSQNDAADLNLNSLKQMKEWCEKRGIKATSFDEKHVEKLMARINAKLDTMDPDWDTKYDEYVQVLQLLETKQILGGSSLKKLQVLLNTVSKDHRLKDQYLHIGAAQSWRTTGRSVQMQNLKRLDGENIAAMEELQDLDVEWDNTKLAENIRQCFTSSHPKGQLVVGDFKSVESRGLAWLAGDTRKLYAYRQGLDLYKVQAKLIYGVEYDAVTKEQRQTGKVGELSCGYGAGGGAVQSFAAGMGVELSEGEANKLVVDWRAANPEVVNLWSDLDGMLAEAVDHGNITTIRVGPNGDYKVKLYPTVTPDSLLQLNPKATTLCLELLDPKMHVIMRRYFHGVYRRGKDICYYKPTDRKTGDVWKAHYQDPKTKLTRFYNVYGGKLAGILTQSFCREIFFSSLKKVAAWCAAIENVDLIGQFHDEIVVDWRPPALPRVTGQADLEGVILGMNLCMSDAGDIRDFPLEADIKHDYRYTK